LDGCAGTKVAVYGMAVNAISHSGRRRMLEHACDVAARLPLTQPRAARHRLRAAAADSRPVQIAQFGPAHLPRVQPAGADQIGGDARLI
jgi:hypothetical protein